MTRLTRRGWLKGAAAAALAAPLAPRTLPVVRLGPHGKAVPRLGLGAFPLGTLRRAGPALELLRSAFAAGIRYVDTAPSYSRGRSERRIGAVLREFPRREFFLATKTLARDEEGARRDLEGSLERLGVEAVDAIQVHEIHNDWRRLDPERGVLKALLRAREEGLVRMIGATCHRNPVYAVRALERFPFQLLLVPVNPLDPKHRSFVTELLPAARERKIPVVAMKVFAGGRLTRRLAAAACLRYALSQPGVAVAVPGLRTRAELEAALSAARGFRPLDRAAQATLVEQAGPHHGSRSEWYKED